ncbi:hypothetical protein IWW45_007046 [Coemansia sp. RSA 485]|nr:hypothetical protein IWW45_007046 [Coemansia sp. RSA 485]
MPVSIESRQSAKKRVAVVGSGLAGLTAAHFLQKGGWHVELFEKGSAVGMDAGSVTVDDVRVDVPFRVFTPDYYPYLYSMYRYLGIDFSSADYSLGFCRAGQSIWSYTNFKIGNLVVPIPDNVAMGGTRLEITRNWIRLSYTCLRLMRMPGMLLCGGLSRATIAEYLAGEGYGQEFIDFVFLPFMASLLTCSLDAAGAYPANTVLHFVGKVAFGAHVRKARDGVQAVCQALTKGLKRIHLNANVDKIEILSENNIVVTNNGKSLHFDALVLATPADTAAELLGKCIVGSSVRYPPTELLQAIRSVPYEDATVYTHRDSSVMPIERKHWHAVNLCTVPGCQHVMATHWINRVEESSSGRVLREPLFQTVDPLNKELKQVVSSTPFHRSLVTIDSQLRINNIHRFQGHSGIWVVGTYTAPGVPLLEGCVRTALEVALAMGAQLPFDPPKLYRMAKQNNTRYEVGLAPGMVRGEVVEAYFECDAAGTFAYTCPELTVLLDALAARSWRKDVVEWFYRFGLWAIWTIMLPAMMLWLAVIDMLLCTVLGKDQGARVQTAAIDVVVYTVCVGLAVFRKATEVVSS